MTVSPAARRAARGGSPAAMCWTVPGGGARLVIPWSKALTRKGGIWPLYRELSAFDDAFRAYDRGEREELPTLPSGATLLAVDEMGGAS